MTGAVHQFVPRLEPSAVGVHVLEVQRVLRNAGFVSEIFAPEIDDRWAGRGRLIGEYGARVPVGTDDVIMYQYAIGSYVADLVRSFPGRLVVNSHSQTPPELLEPWDRPATHGVRWGIKQLAELGGLSRLGIADSHFNADEMRAAGFTDVVVVPVFTEVAVHERDPQVLAERTAGSRWLFVGRLSANKMQHRIVQALAWYRTVYDPDAELVLVGGGTDGRYGRAVRRLVRDLGLEGAVTMTGPVSNATLAAHYAVADVFVCLSEHEGFCVPLLEAMRSDLPIVAYGAAAVPETLGGAGIVLRSTRPSVVAAAAHRIVTDEALRSALIARGRVRSADFAADVVERALLTALAPVLA